MYYWWMYYFPSQIDVFTFFYIHKEILESKKFMTSAIRWIYIFWMS